MKLLIGGQFCGAVDAVILSDRIWPL